MDLGQVKFLLDEPAAVANDRELIATMPCETTKRRLLILAEVALVLAIAGLLILNWLPAMIGAQPSGGR